MRILVCGSRDFPYSKRSIIYRVLDLMASEFNQKTSPDEFGNWLPTFTIISGGAPGADTIAEDYAVTNWCNGLIFRADWKKHGRKAGPIRNQQMLDEGKPDIVIAFPIGKSPGTRDMIKRAKKAGIPVRVFESDSVDGLTSSIL